MPVRVRKDFFKNSLIYYCYMHLLTIEIMSLGNRIQFSLISYFMFHLLPFTCLKVTDMVKNIKWKLKLFFCRSFKLMKTLLGLVLEALIDWNLKHFITLWFTVHSFYNHYCSWVFTLPVIMFLDERCLILIRIPLLSNLYINQKALLASGFKGSRHFFSLFLNFNLKVFR